MPAPMTREEREAFLADIHVGVLSIDEPGRGPLSVPVWYLYEPGGEIVVVTRPEARKAPLLAVGARVGFLVQSEELLSDNAYDDNAAELDEIVANWFRGQTLIEAMAQLEGADAIAGPLYDIRDIVKDPHYLAREDIVEVTDDDLGTVRMHGVIPKFSRTPGAIRRSGGDRGNDNNSFFGDLGMDSSELQALRREGVI